MFEVIPNLNVNQLEVKEIAFMLESLVDGLKAWLFVLLDDWFALNEQES